MLREAVENINQIVKDEVDDCNVCELDDLISARASLLGVIHVYSLRSNTRF